MSLPAIAANNLTYDYDARNLLVTTDISTGDIIFTSEKHGISPKVLGSLFAEVAASSTASAPSIRVYEVDSEGNELRTILKRKRAFFFFCMADGTDVPSRVSTSTDGTTMANEVVTYLNEIFQKTAATTPLTLDFGPSDLLDVTLDSTSTTLLFSNGRTHAVNSIKAFETSSGLVNIRDFSGSNDLMRNVRHNNISIAGESAGLTAAAVVNSLNAMFQLSAVGSGRIPVPAFYREDPTSITNNMAEEFTPTTGLIGANSLNTDGHGSRLWSTEKIKNPGEEFVVKITGEGDFMIGLVQEGTTQFDELSDNDSSLAHAAAMTWGHMFQDNTTHISPQQNYGTLTGVIQGVGWQGSDKLELMRYNSEVQDNFSNGNPNLFKIAINADRRIELSYYDAGRTNTYILVARSSAAVSFSDGYHLVVKLIDGSVKVTETPFISTVTADNASGLVYYFIESPDGSFDYPLFNSTQQAAQADLNAGGTGTYATRVYADDPTNTTWYSPTTGFTEDGTSAPLDTTTITYNEITTEADGLHVPSQLALNDHTFTENQSVNIQIVPAGDLAATVTNLPGGLSHSNGFITGTTRYVTGNEVTTVTVERTNAFGTTTQTFDITITDDTSINTLSGWTALKSDQIAYAPDNIPHYSPEAAFDFNLTLNQDTQFNWTQTNGSSPNGGPGQFMQLGIVSSGVNKATATLGNNTSNWDLRATFWTTTVNLSGNGGTGWVDNTWTDTGSNDGVDWALAYEQDGADYKIVLYRNNVELYRSADAYTGDQTFTVAIPAAYNQNSRLPAITRTAIGAGTTTPPTGFNDPLTQGEMGSTTLLGNGDDAVATLTDTLAVNHRYIMPQTWVEANVLPHHDDAEDKVFFGIPKTSAAWSVVQLDDFDMAIRLQGRSNLASHKSLLWDNGSNNSEVIVNSATDAYYDYAIEWDGTDLHAIACSVSGDISTQPGINNGGTFTRTITHSSFTEQISPFPLVLATNDGGQVNLTTTGLQQIRIPFGANDILVGESSSGNGNFTNLMPATSLYDTHSGGHAPSGFTYNAPFTLNAGYTYRFLYHASMEADDKIEFRLASDGTTVYTTGVSQIGTITDDPTFTSEYKGIEFAVPSDVPPLQIFYYNGYSSSYDGGRAVTISGSTYVAPVTGVTQEGPAANQTSNNLFDTGDHGWVSVDEPLGAGERLVLDSAFLADLVGAMPDNGAVFVGVKDTGWTNSNDWYAGFEGGIHMTILRYSTSDVRLYVETSGSATSTYFTSLANITANSVEAFFEITSSGNNVRGGVGTDDADATAYADWSSSYKLQTGNQGYGLTSVDVMIQGRALPSNAAGMDLSDVDWTGLSEISVPTPAATLTTSWTRALDFSGSNERALQVDNDNNWNPMRMGGIASTIGAPTAGYTVSSTSGRPWATACVFQVDGNSSNQHIWNQGEGAGSTDDNIYLRVDASRNLYFGWGRSGALNELFFGQLSTSNWYGVYIAHTGERLSGANATAANLADCFDVRLYHSGNSFNGYTQYSTSSQWGHSGSTVGGRMDRAVIGDLTVGGRGSNRNFHGRVASMVTTTLLLGQAMPTTSEAEMMVRDPEQWLLDYKVGNNYRIPQSSTYYTNFQLNAFSPSYATQVWLMGDGTSDAYATIRNQVYDGTQNQTPMNMISMVSNDIVTINIPGLT